MEANSRSTDWRSILLLIFSVSSMALMLIAAIITFALVATERNNLPGFQAATNASSVAVALTAGAMIAIGALLAPAAWLSIRRLRGKKSKQLNLPALKPWAWIAILSAWLMAITFATVFYGARGAGWYVPLLHFLSIGLPVYLIIRISINRIPLGSNQRVWGVFGSGLILSPILAIIAELIILLFGVIGVGVYLGLNPEKMFEFQRLVNQIETAPTLESMLYLLEPTLKNPLTLLTALTLLSVFVPIIEETAKSIGVWLVADRITSLAQGFAMGVISGAGFALAESLFASITPDETWALTLSVRAVSSSMHMLATGLAGWGIAYIRLEKRYFTGISISLLSILLHAFWNAGAVLATAGSLRVFLMIPDFDILGMVLALGGSGLLLVLTLGMLIAFFVINANFRKSNRVNSTSEEPVKLLR